MNSGVNHEVFKIFPHFQLFQQLNFNTKMHDLNLISPRQVHAVSQALFPALFPSLIPKSHSRGSTFWPLAGDGNGQRTKAKKEQKLKNKCNHALFGAD